MAVQLEVQVLQLEVELELELVVLLASWWAALTVATAAQSAACHNQQECHRVSSRRMMTWPHR